MASLCAVQVSSFLFYFSLIVLSIRLVCELTARKPLQVEIATLGIMKPFLGGAIPYIAPAMETGVTDLNTIYAGVLNVSQTYIYNESFLNCFPNQTDNAERMLAEYYYEQASKDAVIAFVAPGCNDVELVNRLAKVWNVMQITCAGDTGHGRSRIKSPTWITVARSADFNFVFALETIFSYYKWISAFIVWDLDSNPMFRSIGQSVYNKLIANGRGLQLTIRIVKSINDTSLDNEKFLLDFRRSSRIMVFFGHSNVLRTIMLQALKLNMTNGEYIYFGIQPHYHAWTVGLFKWKNADPYDEDARNAYRSVLVLGFPYSDSDYSDPVLMQVVRGWMNQTLLRYNITMTEENPYTRQLYNGLMMFGQVVNETFFKDPLFDFKNGAELAKKFLNRTFVSKMGTTMVSQYGDLVMNLTIRSLNPETGTMDIVAIFHGINHELIHVRKITWPNGHGPPANVPECGYLGDAPQCQPQTSTASLYGGIFGAFIVVIVAPLGMGLYLRHRAEINDEWWNIKSSEISRTSSIPTHMFNLSTCSDKEQDTFLGGAIYMGTNVWMKELHPTLVLTVASDDESPLKVPIAARRFLNLFKRQFVHPNINRFIGLCARSDLTAASLKYHRLYVISEHCARGSLRDLLSIKTPDWEICCSMIVDILKGIKFIHASTVKFHGNLTETKFVVDKFFILKIGEFGLDTLCEMMEFPGVAGMKAVTFEELVCTPPEVLRQQTNPDQTSDIYATGVVLAHLLIGSLPYDEELLKGLDETTWADDSILPSPRVTVENGYVEKITLLGSCWNENAAARPNISELKGSVYAALGSDLLSQKTGSVAENLLRRFAKYSTELEGLVHLRTRDFLTEKQKCERLLQEMLPREVISDLQKGIPVLPENFESVTVLFTSLVGFMTVVSELTPFAISNLLGFLFDVMDRACEAFRVYKVETIADTYMVASGLPVRIGLTHVKEICGVAQEMMSATSSEFVEQYHDLDLCLKIGIHTGSCVAGIVGINRPRYCLFGDTINVASRMCLTSEPGKIHISPPTGALIMKHFPEFTLKARGSVSVKGKGEMFTFWLQ